MGSNDNVIKFVLFKYSILLCFRAVLLIFACITHGLISSKSCNTFLVQFWCAIVALRTTWLAGCVCHGFCFYFFSSSSLPCGLCTCWAECSTCPNNRYACKHRSLYAYAHRDSTLHEIQKWNQKQELSDNNKENKPDIINNVCIFVPGAMNRLLQRI